MAGIGATQIKQICFCVWDLAKAEKTWTTMLGLQPVRRQTPPWSELPSYTNDIPDTFVGEEFLVYELDGGVALEIFGPGKGKNPWRDFLEKNGEGLMNLAFFVPDRQAAYDVIGQVSEAKRPYHEGFYATGTYTFVDTMKELGTELNIKKDEDNTALINQLAENPASYRK